ncbi:MAG: universal stress protein [Pseudomonadota bacterium]
MHDIKKILLATTQSAQSRNAELRAALLSAQLDVGAFDMIAVRQSRRGMGAPLTTFSHLEVGCGVLRAWIAGQRRPFALPDHPDALDVLWNVQPRPAAAIVVGRAQEMAADLTILAPHRRNAFLKLLATSDSDEIVRRSRNAVLVVHREPREVYQRVLVAVDFSQDALNAARMALALAPAAHFTFLHAYRLPDEGLMREFDVPAGVVDAYLVRGCEAARERLSGWIDSLKPMRQPRARAVHSGFPVPVIRSCARRIGADLVVLGRQGQGRRGRDALGEAPRRLGRDADCDVLIGPAGTQPPRSAVHGGASGMAEASPA